MAIRIIEVKLNPSEASFTNALKSPNCVYALSVSVAFDNGKVTFIKI